MNRVLLAALALACVCSPALAAADPAFNAGRGFAHALFAFTLGSMMLGLVLGLFPILWRNSRHAFALSSAASLVALGLLLLGAIPALAQTAPAATNPGVTIPYGQWIVDFGPQIAGWAATALAAVVSVAVAKWAPWASSIATQQRIQMAAEALAQYAIKAIPDSTRDGKVTVNAGPKVVAEAVQHGIDVLPKKVVDAMQKGDGMASIIFRVLDLEDDASKHNVLAPAAAILNAKGIATKA